MEAKREKYRLVQHCTSYTQKDGDDRVRERGIRFHCPICHLIQDSEKYTGDDIWISAIRHHMDCCHQGELVVSGDIRATFAGL
jgi:hypothetical protein